MYLLNINFILYNFSVDKMGKYVLIWFVKHNCIRVFSVSELIIQKNSFYVLSVLLGYDLVQFLGVLFFCKLYTVFYFCGSSLSHRI